MPKRKGVEAPSHPSMPSPRIIAIANNKGGVGKTTTAINLTGALVTHEKRVLLIDLDPQANASIGLNVLIAPTAFGTKLLLQDDRYTIAECVYEKSPFLDVIPSHRTLADTQHTLLLDPDGRTRLRAKLQTGGKPYDVILLDCPPEVGLLSQSALVAATDVLIPVDVGYFSVDGLENMLEIVERIKHSHNPSLNLFGILVTKFDARGKLRRMNCGECRGKGTTACESCHRGNLECPTCARAKRLECWWEVTGGDRDVDVQVEPDGEETAAFSWGQDGIEATPEEVTADARLVYTIRRDRAIVADELPREISLEWQARHWVALQAKLDAGERIVAQELSYLEVPSVTIRYATAKDAQTISLEGRRFLAPPLRDDRILHQRAASLGVWQVLLGIPPLLLLVLYAARGSYFLTGTLAAMGGAAAVLSICAYRWIWSRGLATTA